MVESIVKIVKDIIFDSCNKYAKKERINIEDAQLMLTLKFVETEEGTKVLNNYFFCQQYQIKKECDICGVLGRVADFIGYGNMAEPFIMKSLFRYSEEKNIPLEKISIMCVPYTYINDKWKKKNSVNLYLYNGNEYVPTTYKDEEEKDIDGISFNDLFKAEDFQIPTE